MGPEGLERVRALDAEVEAGCQPHPTMADVIIRHSVNTESLSATGLATVQNIVLLSSAVLCAPTVGGRHAPEGSPVLTENRSPKRTITRSCGAFREA